LRSCMSPVAGVKYGVLAGLAEAKPVSAVLPLIEDAGKELPAHGAAFEVVALVEALLPCAQDDTAPVEAVDAVAPIVELG